MKHAQRYLVILAMAFLLAVTASGCPRAASVAKSVTPVLDTEYATTALRLIDDAKRSVVLCIYEIRYYERHKAGPTNALIDALIAAKKRGVEVTAVINIDSWQRKNTEENRDVGAYLEKNSVRVLYDSMKQTTHVKLLVTDHRWTLIGSHNWSYSALAKNHEASVLIDDEPTARQFEEYAKRIP